MSSQAYCSQAAVAEAWQVDFISRESVNIQEACIRVEMQHLTTGDGARGMSQGADARQQRGGPAAAHPDSGRLSGASHLRTATQSETLRTTFPKGVPNRLLVVGAGGTGKVWTARAQRSSLPPRGLGWGWGWVEV